MAYIAITNDLALAVGAIADTHPRCSIEIRWLDGLSEREWIVTASDGTTEDIYLCDDEEGTYVQASDETLANVSYPRKG